MVSNRWCSWQLGENINSMSSFLLTKTILKFKLIYWCNDFNFSASHCCGLMFRLGQTTEKVQIVPMLSNEYSRI